MAAAPDPKDILVFTFQHNEDDTINVDKSLRSFFNIMMNGATISRTSQCLCSAWSLESSLRSAPLFARIAWCWRLREPLG